ncbi:hypothetical protein DFJ73DRAFT_759494 [Zopfochytrium polystomum]|nr:hypothetical protein DFJ73DRAFT_759494 [Zopfochytrium polystomum]
MGTVCMPQDLAPPMIHSPSEHSSPDVHRPRRSGSTAAPSELATRMQTQLPSGLATWLPDLVGREDLSVEDLEDMFILIQVLSVAHPASVDLTWYMTDEALSHPDLTNRNQQVLFAGLAESRISLSDSQRRGIAAGDPWVAAEVAELIWKSRGESNALDSEHVARASYEDPCRIFRPESAKFRISPGGSYDRRKPRTGRWTSLAFDTFSGWLFAKKTW